MPSLADIASLKYDWFQTESFVVIELRIKDKKEEEVSVEFTPDNVKVTVANGEPNPLEFSITPCESIVAEQSSFKVLKMKIEIKLKKTEGIRWESLEKKEDSEASQVKTMLSSIPSSEVPPTYPSSSKKKHDWSEIEAQVIKEEEENPDDDVFRLLGAQSGDDQRKAMNKSYYESGGKVLSMDWEKVKDKKVEYKPMDSTINE